ncbi:hypothetical protein [Paenibacillus glycinis]|uniref:Spore germination protein n=1 Tax=Paenibacillus glycinis TaxID=2697035 RepID=A0ABW9XKZ5_9BACL|nr:hypothetical protein [Paenibacillus glycinis]NBD23287.1 hypothetical protein [Paenibacillus glycinis]
MSRYLYYHVLYVGMINIMMFVPYLLVRDRFEGAISGMLVAVGISTALSLGIVACFGRFPGMGFPEINDLYLPRWLWSFNLLFGGLCVWLPAGIIVIYSYAETSRLFFYPDMNPYVNLFLLAGASVWASSRSTRTVQFIQEIAMIVITPMLILFLIKAMFDDNMDWDAIRYVAGYVRKPPSFVAIASGTFLFSGYMNLVISNRLHVKRIRFRWIIPVFGTLFLAITFFVPIGFHGTQGVEDYVYLWSMTADSMALDYGFINRVLYVFLLMFTGISLLFIMNTWHTAILFVRYALNRYKGVEEESVSGLNVWMSAAIGILAFVYMSCMNPERNQLMSQLWIIIRFFAEIATLFLMVYFVRKRIKQTEKEKALE